jgi:hypothetical protein
MFEQSGRLFVPNSRTQRAARPNGDPDGGVEGAQDRLFPRIMRAQRCDDDRDGCRYSCRDDLLEASDRGQHERPNPHQRAKLSNGAAVCDNAAVTLCLIKLIR